MKEEVQEVHKPKLANYSEEFKINDRVHRIIAPLRLHRKLKKVNKLILPNQKHFQGVLVGKNVIVNDLSLFLHGCYGKGNLSRSIPSLLTTFHSFNDPILINPTYEEQNINDVCDEELIMWDGENLNKQIIPCVDKTQEAIEKQIPPNEHVAFQPSIHDEPSNVAEEHLVLSLVESFYLKHVHSCLDIEGLPDDLQECWETLCQFQSDFPLVYAIYYYYRQLGWIVRVGLNFGCDFVLYRYGPSIDHGTYCITIDREHQISWRPLLHQLRMTISVAKQLISVQLFDKRTKLPLKPSDIKSPSDLSFIEANQLLYKRVVPKLTYSHK
mmetsp:Transcript_5781/g.8506  ORF Transcript_5781/g.8506 Transcript_5781/m.8506 type:complete len:326 (+) Transcript_5781:1078-2055(+)